MLTLFHHPLDASSRAIRLALAEHGITPALVEEHPWERREAFLMFNPAGTLPVLVSEGKPALCGASVILEFLDETRGAYLADRRLMPLDPHARAEVRRLIQWFDQKMAQEVTALVVGERVFKRYKKPHEGGGSPDNAIMRAGRHNLRHHIHYMAWLLRDHNWLTGDRMSYADLVAGAHFSAIDYLGDVPWQENDIVKSWYQRLKSRPSFRPLLSDIMPGLPPPPSYIDLDF